MRSASVSIPVLLWIGTSAVAEPVETLTHCEDLSGWSRAAELSNDAYEGSSAIVASVPSGGTGSVSYDFVDSGKDISNRQSLSFWWKVEGNGLSELKIRVRNFPLASAQKPNTGYGG